VVLTSGCAPGSPPSDGASTRTSENSSSVEAGPSTAVDPETESPDQDTDRVDIVFDHFISGTLILTQRNPLTRDGVILQFEEATNEWREAADELRLGIRGVPDKTRDSTLNSLDQTLEAMTAVNTCFRSSPTTTCDAEISVAKETNYELGRTLAALIPYGKRSDKEILAALRGEVSVPRVATEAESVSQSNARKKAEDYLNYTAFSRKGLVEQLEYEGFSNADAVYGTNSSGADWNEQAALKAKSYLEYSSFSRRGLIEQLEYEGFTMSEATYGVNAVGL